LLLPSWALVRCPSSPLTLFTISVPGYISRSVAGSYDNEGIAIFALMVCPHRHSHTSYDTRADDLFPVDPRHEAGLDVLGRSLCPLVLLHGRQCVVTVAVA
jgi:hypothetical protein